MAERAPRELQVVPEAPALDLRVLQANERTLLAWIRTGLAIMAFGFVVGRIGHWMPAADVGPWKSLVGAAFVALGTGANCVATARFVRVRRAILASEPVAPGAGAVLTLSVALAILGAILVAYLLIG